MSMDLKVQKFEYKPKNLIAGTKMPIMTVSKETADPVAAGSPVAIGSDGKIKKITASSLGTADVSALYGIAAEAGTTGQKVAVYLTGEFYADELAYESNVATKDVEVAFRKIGIFLV